MGIDTERERDIEIEKRRERDRLWKRKNRKIGRNSDTHLQSKMYY